MRRHMRYGKGYLNSIEQAVASVGAAACFRLNLLIYVYDDVLMIVTRLIISFHNDV